MALATDEAGVFISRRNMFVQALTPAAQIMVIMD
jgi:hypothetical protein